jgi:hypothetical protein
MVEYQVSKSRAVWIDLPVEFTLDRPQESSQESYE